MGTARQVLKEKGAVVWSVSPEATVFEALELMAKKNIGAVLVMKDGKLEGIFSERDYAHRGILEGHHSKETKVSHLMTKAVLHIGPETTMDECMLLFTEKRIRHLPVLENGSAIGVISIGDVVKDVISEQKRVIRDLGNYISGNVEP